MKCGTEDGVATLPAGEKCVLFYKDSSWYEVPTPRSPRCGSFLRQRFLFQHGMSMLFRLFKNSFHLSTDWLSIERTNATIARCRPYSKVVFVVAHGFARQSASMNFSHLPRRFPRYLVVVAIDDVLAFQTKICQPTVADGQIPHVAVEHRQGCRRDCLDQQAQTLSLSCKASSTCLRALMSREMPKIPTTLPSSARSGPQ